MTTVALTPSLGASPFVPLTRPELLIEREDDARNVVQTILTAATRIVILHGATNAGKTRLLKDWVIPAIRTAVGRTGKNVLYAECDPLIPKVFEGTTDRLEDVIDQEGFLFIDQIERVVELHRDDQRGEFDRLFTQVKRPDNRAVVILISDSRQLTSVYSSASFDAQSQPVVCELTGLTVVQALIRLADREASAMPVYTQEVLAAIAKECMALEGDSWSDSFELAKLIHNYCGAYQANSGSEHIGLAEYRDIGSIFGILSARLKQQLKRLEEENAGDSDLARGVLESVLRAKKDRLPLNWADVAVRTGASPDEIARVIRAMAHFAGLVRVKPGGDLRVEPPQLLAIIEDDLKSRNRQVQRAERTVIEGLSSWKKLESLLTRSLFEEVHEERRYLTLDNEQITFLFRCALQFEDSHCPGAVDYWLNRAPSEDGLEVLLGALFHKFKDVRARAATILGGYPLAAVREKLLTAALTDDEPEVRSQALRSLASMTSQELKETDIKELLLKEVNNRASPYRQHAVECLGMLPSPEIARVLKEQVDDPASELPIRQTSIRVLAALNTPEAVDSLIEIAFDDADADDREAAAKALASIVPDNLNRRIFVRLAERDSIRVWATRLVLGFLTLLSATPMVLAYWNGDAADWFVSLWVLAWVGVLPTFILMPRLLDGRTPIRSPLGILGIGLAAVEALTFCQFLHGFAHLTIKKPRRALRIFECELLAAVFLLVALVFKDAPGARLSYWAFLATGILLFVGTYLYDVVEVLNAIICRNALVIRQRQRAVYQEVFTNPVAAQLGFASLEPGEPNRIPSAKRLLTRFGHRVSAAQLVTLLQAHNPIYSRVAARALRKTKPDDTVARLEAAWDSDPSLQKVIARIFYEDPNERSLEALRRLRPRMDRWNSIRARAAWWFYPFAVLPRSLKVAGLVLILIAGPIVYYGLKARNNVTWPQIVSLNQGRLTNEQKFETIHFLGRVYPKAAGAELFSMLKKNRDAQPDSVHAALTEALATIDPKTVGAKDRELHTELDGAMTKYAALLSAGRDSTDLRLALHVMKNVASGRDSILAYKASSILAEYIRANSASQGDALLRREAIESLASGPYATALPLLDKLMSAGADLSRPPAAQAELSEQLEKASVQAFTANLDPDSVGGRRRLLNALRALNNPPRGTLPTLSQYVTRDLRIPQICRDVGLRCDDVEAQSWALADALENISTDPSDEYGYRLLLAYYAKDGDYAAAAERLEYFKRRFPDQVWPRKILAEVWHEGLGPSDTVYFRRSYEAMQELRNLAAYDQLRQSRPSDYRRIESDYIEVAFSAGSFGEADSLATVLLKQSTDTTEIFNAELFAYFSAVMSGNQSLALSRLAQLESTVRSFQGGFNNNWAYPGTIRYIDASTLPGAVKVGLLKLVKTGRWYPQTEAVAIFTENRNLVQTLAVQGR